MHRIQGRMLLRAIVAAALVAGFFALPRAAEAVVKWQAQKLIDGIKSDIGFSPAPLKSPKPAGPSFFERWQPSAELPNAVQVKTITVKPYKPIVPAVKETPWNQRQYG